MSRELLRRLPGVDAWLTSEQGALLSAEYSREEVVEVMRSHLARIRDGLTDGSAELPELASPAYTNLLRADLLDRRQGSLRPVINATGIVIHTNLGRAPLADEAVAAIRAVAGGYSNLEYALDSGSRGTRNDHVRELLVDLTGAEDALVVNNCAAAVLLALQCLAGGGEVLVSRGELIEIGGSFRMPDVIGASGASMVEVGTTNRTTIGDYAAAVTAETRVLLTSHPSNYRIVGFTASPTRAELALLARERGLVTVHDLGSGCLVRLDAFGLAEPTVADCIADGADLVSFSGDKLLGGPQAGIIAGRRELVAQLRLHPLARAMRIDKLSLAALAATLRLYRPPHDPFESVPALRMITASRADIARRAASLAEQFAGLPGLAVALADDVGYAGGGTLPMSELPTTVLCLTADAFGAESLAAKLRAADPPVIGRIAGDAVVLDPRTVQPGETPALVAALRAALA